MEKAFSSPFRYEFSGPSLSLEIYTAIQFFILDYYPRPNFYIWNLEPGPVYLFYNVYLFPETYFIIKI